MLKPRKSRKARLIITPQLKVAVGKKLFVINGKWAGDEFVKYVNASPSMRPQFGMVGRKLGNIYRRHMEKCFPIDRKVDWTKLHGVPDTETELPQRQTGRKALAEILSGKTGFARSVPTLVGGGDVTTSRIDFNHHDHVPNTDQKHYFATAMVQSGHSAVKEGTLIEPALEIKGVHLKQSKVPDEEVRRLIAGFGDIAEKELMERFYAQLAIINPGDEEAIQKAARACMWRELEAN